MRESLTDLKLWNLKPLEAVPEECGSEDGIARTRVPSKGKRKGPKGWLQGSSTGQADQVRSRPGQLQELPGHIHICSTFSGISPLVKGGK